MRETSLMENGMNRRDSMRSMACRALMPVARRLAVIDPTEVPTTVSSFRSCCSRCSSMAFKTPICANPLSPPPENTTAAVFLGIVSEW